MSISTLRRQVKNVAYNFSDAQVKVREATSNDPWGPTTALMSEIADLTHNPMSFTEIMSMLWKRLNDHGKNWRHVYKSLVLLDYLIKCGSEKVAQQCRENIYSIETLKDFQHIEDNRDQGLNVREKAKQMVSLLHDEERLKNERARFLLTRKRFIQNGAAVAGISSDGTTRTNMRRPHDTAVTDSEFEEARPSSLGEEEMQLQIAMALSREECEKEEELRKGDAIRLQIALEESQREIASRAEANGHKMISSTALSQSALEDLLSMGLGEQTMGNGSSSSHLPSTSSQAFGGDSHQLIDPWSPRPSGSSSAATNGSHTLKILTSMFPYLKIGEMTT
uniref:ENTH domain-containing protein n=1 Tax=Ditylenchus dipsaci TaxID=166011 RepID=A0A915E0A9_9BILA